MQKEHSKSTGTSWKITNATSKCPYGKCDGSGIIQLVNDRNEFKAKICKCRQEKIFANRIKFANIPEEFTELTIKSFNTSLYSTKENQNIANIAKKITVNYLKNFKKFQEVGKGLYFYSSTKGSGKTRLAVSMGNALLNALRQQVKFITCVDLLAEIKNTFNQNAEYTQSQLIEGINNVSVLILDDIGVERPTAWVAEVLFSILDNRMKHNRVTIFTSNCAIEQLQHDDRIKSRLFKMCIPVKMPEEDIRKKISQKENKELQDMLLK